MVIPMLTATLLALRDDGKLSLNDKLAKWLPQYPNAARVTLRMLAASASGYPDYIQSNERFRQILFSNPFRRWTDDDAPRSPSRRCMRTAETAACTRTRPSGARRGASATA